MPELFVVEYGIGEKVDQMRVTAHLPEYPCAEIDEAKLTQYSLCSEGDGEPYARRFAQELHIRLEHWEYLRDQILEGLSEAPAILHKEHEKYGPMWESPVVVEGRNGCKRILTTGWARDPQRDGPHLTCVRVSETERRPRQFIARGLFGYPGGEIELGLQGCPPFRVLRRVPAGY